MNRVLGTSVLVVALSALPIAMTGCVTSSNTASAPMLQETGVLRSGIPANANAWRSWSINPGAGEPSIPADVSGIRARARQLDGHSVRAWGRYVDRRQRGAVTRVFRVERLEGR